ncbi:MAG: transcriptional repressor [Spirochaetes bacterium]|nr:transcriptional repressor [Spirochaetota bacterium]
MRTSYTETREQILETINTVKSPLSAQQVHARCGLDVNLATVYRALHYLEQIDRVDSFTMLCSRDGTNRYFHSKAAPHRHFFHCDSCHRFIPIDRCPVADEIASVEAELGCEVRSHVLYYVGLCAECRTERAETSERQMS